MRRRKRLEVPGEEVAGAAAVGALLRRRREERGLAPEDVGLAIRCGAGRLRAVEEGRFEELPPQPYGRGLIAAYARLVGIDEAALLRACGPAFLAAAGASGPGAAVPPSRGASGWRDWVLPLAFAGAVVAFVTLRALLLPPPQPIEEAAVPAAGSARQEAAELAAFRAAAEALLWRPPPPAGPPAVSGVLVLLRSEGTTWVDAGVDGGELRRVEVGPGQNVELAARERLALTLGDAGVLRVTVNGRELGFIGSRGEVRAGVVFTAKKAAPAAAGVATPGER